MATNKPSIFLWATGAASTREDPGAAKKAAGWAENEAPGSKVFNFIQNFFTTFISHVNTHGVPQWDNATDYAAGALSYNNGVIYARNSAGSGGSQPGATNSPWTVYAVTPLGGNVTVNVPSDYATLQEAFDAYRNRPANGFFVTINVEAGHSPASGIVATNGNFGHIRVDSADNQITMAGSTGANTDFLYLTNTVGPELNTTVNMAGNGRHGLLLDKSVTFVKGGEGVVNAGQNGIQLQKGSYLDAANTVFSGATSYGLRSFDTSRANLAGSDLSGAGNVGIEANSGSDITAQDVDVTGAGAIGIQSSGANVVAANADASGFGGGFGFAVINGGKMSVAGTTGAKNIALNTPTAQGLFLG